MSASLKRYIIKLLLKDNKKKIYVVEQPNQSNALDDAAQRFPEALEISVRRLYNPHIDHDYDKEEE